MKVLYLESKYKQFPYILDSEFEKLPKTIFLAYSIQYQSLAFCLKKRLESLGHKIASIEQVLGCSKIKTKFPVLLIGSGKFHAINLYLQAKEIYLLEASKITKLDPSEIEKHKNKKKAALAKYLMAENIGLIVSTKLGQENLDYALSLKKKIERKGKNTWIFLSNNIDISQFENFNIDSWVNTACPGLANDNPLIINSFDVV
jgi:diphthamide biosynthesis enzyme Dph1/Dph2-like protein